MDKCNGSDIAINKILLRLVQPYSDSLIEKLKNDLIETTDKRVVHIWNGYHLDDIEVHKICEQFNLDYVEENLNFPDINSAAIYICMRQLKRTDLSIEYNKYLIGQLYYYQHAIRPSLKSGDSGCAIAQTIGACSYISAGTVRKYYQYAMAINVIFDQDTVFAKSILSGKLRLSHESIIELARLRPDEIRAVAKSSFDENKGHITLSYIRNEVKWSHVQERNPVSRRERSEAKVREKVTIRQMPEYDPDSEVNSLCLTIDSWISSIQRVKSSESFPRITKMANLNLLKKLSILEHTINQIQESLVERTNINE